MADGLMVFKYGAHEHPPGEVNLTRMEIIPRYSKMNERMWTDYRLHVTGELIYDGQDAIKPKIDQLIDAYRNNDKTAGLYHTDGTPTKHVLDTNHSANISGNRIEYRSWPRGAPDEYATVRTFYVVIKARFLDPDSGLVEWRESIRTRGTGGPRWRWQMQFNGTTSPVLNQVQQITQPFTTQTIVQQGFAKGLTLYPAGNVPAPVFPDWEHEEMRVGPTREDATWQGQGYTGFGIRWAYYMEAPAGVSVTPNLGF